MKIKLLTFVIVLLSSFSYSQNTDWDWGIKAGGTPQSNLDVDLCVDTEGNMVLAGYFDGTISIGPFSITSDNDHDMYLCRINSDKVVEWLVKVDTDCQTYSTLAVTLDDDNNIYVTGVSNGATLVAKYDLTGNEIWSTVLTPENGGGKSIAVDQYDNVYISAGSGWNFFMAKFNPQGEVIWTKDFWYNSSDACSVNDIAVDATGNIYFVGVFTIGELILDNFVLNYDSSINYDTFWGKMDTNGNFIWLESSQGDTIGTPQIALTSDDHIYIAGSKYSALSFDGVAITSACCSAHNPFIAKYTTAGEKVFAMTGHTTFNGNGTVGDIKVDNAGKLYVTGTFFTTYGVGLTGYNCFIEMYDPVGVHQWRKEFAMLGDDFGLVLDVDNNGFCYYAGHNESLTFIDEDQVGTYSVGIGQYNTLMPTYKETVRPQAEDNYIVCDADGEATLTAEGTELKWYSDPELSTLVHSGDQYTAVFTDGAEYFVTQTVNGVESWPKVITVTFSEVVSAEIIAEGQTLIVTESDDLNYQWYYQGNAIANANENSLVIEPGTQFLDYIVVVSDEVCSIELQFDNLQVKFSEFQNDLKIYPNPTKDKINLAFSQDMSVDEIIVTNSIGQTIIANSIVGNSDLITIELGDYEAGVYFVKLTARGISKRFKIIKQ